MMGNWGFFGMSMMWLVWLPLVALFVWFIIRITRNNENSQSAGRNAVDILKEKFAEGEISKEEFEERIKILRRS
ncbi:MAG: SHOCT domain-containing protein [Bacteroidales bacterium]|nr:SHOCT domain-containing protein [Bacteroidales bacterium]